MKDRPSHAEDFFLCFLMHTVRAARLVCKKITSFSASSLSKLPFVLLFAVKATLAEATVAASLQASPANETQAAPAKTIVDLQQHRRSVSIRATFEGGRIGIATLTDLNPQVGAWYLLTLDFGDSGLHRAYHLENPSPRSQRFRIDDSYPLGISIDSADGPLRCDLWSTAPVALEQARRNGGTYAPLCGGRLYLRNPTTGKATRLEQATDFLREHIWGGDRIVSFVRREFFQDAFLEKGIAQGSATPSGAQPALPDAPVPASLSPTYAAVSVLPEHLDINLARATGGMVLGRWYEAKGLSGVYVSAIQPHAIASQILSSKRERVKTLDAVEADALDYLVAFDLADFDLGFAVGTVHPKVYWSARVLDEVRDSALPGPDGIGTIAPLIANGMVSPWLASRTVATFTGGFKREHGAFQHGALAHQNHGSHYGFIEQGVVMSKLVPGLSTLFVLDDGSVAMKTWDSKDDVLLPRIRDARQNGVPLIEYDEKTGLSTPGALVARWGQGNWSASAEENPRTLRAGACLQENDSKRFLIYGYFSGATPSAMTRVFQAYDCRYAMHLDMNALEHTYLALYVRNGSQVEVEHLIEDMSEVDEKTAAGLVPRFLGVPDDRDFFYVTRRKEQ